MSPGRSKRELSWVIISNCEHMKRFLSGLEVAEEIDGFGSYSSVSPAPASNLRGYGAQKP